MNMKMQKRRKIEANRNSRVVKSRIRKYKGSLQRDATRDMNLRVSDGDITLALAADPHHCVAANTCLREIKGAALVEMGMRVARVKIGKVWIRFALHQNLMRSIRVFDKTRGRVWGDRNIHLMAPSGTWRLGVKHKVGPGIKPRPRGRGVRKYGYRTNVIRTTYRAVEAQ